MSNQDSDNSDYEEDYEMKLLWSYGHRQSATHCVCDSEWRCRCRVQLTRVPK